MTHHRDLDYNAAKPWDQLDCQRLWAYYIKGHSIGEIARLLERTTHEVMCKRWKLICANGRDKAGSALVAGPDRRGVRWTKRDVQVLRLAKDNGVSTNHIAELLGRTVEEVHRQLNPRHGAATFFPMVKETR